MYSKEDDLNLKIDYINSVLRKLVSIDPERIDNICDEMCDIDHEIEIAETKALLARG